MREPNQYTHKEDSQLELKNTVVIFCSMLVLPYALYLFSNSLLLTFAIEFAIVAGVLDLVLTSDALHRGYKEQNYYRIFFRWFGDKKGFRVTAIVNFATRIVVFIVLYSEPYFIMLVALGSLAGPLWNALTMRTFRDDILLAIETDVAMDDMKISIDNGKKRLEDQKDGAESN